MNLPSSRHVGPLTVLVSTLAVLGAGLAAPATAAVADRPSVAPTAQQRGVDYDYPVTNVGGTYKVRVGDFGVCLDVRYTGKLEARTYVQNRKRFLDRPKMKQMTLSVVTRRDCSATSPVKKRNTFDTIEYSTALYGHDCSFDPSFSAGFPWSVGVSVTPDCGNERVAKLGDKQTGTRRAFNFAATTKVEAGWKDEDKHGFPPGGQPSTAENELCTSVSALITLRRTQGPSRPSVTLKVPFRDACIRN